MKNVLSRARRSLSSSPRIGILAGLCAGLTAAGILIARAETATSGDPESRLQRQVRVMEKGIEDMLVESPNFLVTGGGRTRGIVVDGYGAIFSFDASLTLPGWEADHRGWGFGSWFGPRGSRIIVRKGHGDGDADISIDGSDIVVEEGKVYSVDADGKKHRLSGDDGTVMDEKSYREEQGKKYERAKAELVQALLDYGETLKALPAGTSVQVVACFSDLELPGDRKIEQFSVTARTDDLRSYGEGKITESQMRDRVSLKES